MRAALRIGTWNFSLGTSRVVALEVPVVGGGVGETEEVAGVELDVPFELLPAFGRTPPVAGQGEGAVEVEDPAAMRAGENGKRVGVTAMAGGEVEGDRHFEWGAEAGHGEPAGAGVSHGGMCSRACGTTGAGEERLGGGEVEGVGAVGEVGDGETDTAFAEQGDEADEGAGETVWLTDAVAEKLMLSGVGFAGA